MPDPMAETWEELDLCPRLRCSTDIEAFTSEIDAQVVEAEWEQRRGTASRGITLRAPCGARRACTTCGRTLPGPDQAESILAAKLASRRAVDIAVKQLYAQKSDLWANTDINIGASRALQDARASCRRSAAPCAVFRSPGGLVAGAVSRCRTAGCRGVGEAGGPEPRSRRMTGV